MNFIKKINFKTLQLKQDTKFINDIINEYPLNYSHNHNHLFNENIKLKNQIIYLKNFIKSNYPCSHNSSSNSDNSSSSS